MIDTDILLQAYRETRPAGSSVENVLEQLNISDIDLQSFSIVYGEQNIDNVRNERANHFDMTNKEYWANTIAAALTRGIVIGVKAAELNQKGDPHGR